MAHRRFHIYIAVAEFLRELCGALFNVVAMVAVLWKFHRILALINLQITRFQRIAKLFNLVARVVDVKFAPHGISRRVQYRCQTVAQSAAACISHVHRTRRIGGNKLHHDLFPLAVFTAAIRVSQCLNVFQYIHIELLAQKEIDKTGAGDFKTVKIGAVQGQIVCDRLRDFAGGCVEGARAYHCSVGGPIAVCPVCGYLDGKFRNVRLRQFAVGTGFFHGGTDNIPQFSGRLLHEF